MFRYKNMTVFSVFPVTGPELGGTLITVDGTQFAPVAGELKLVYGLSGLFILAYVLVASPLGTAADVAAGTFF